MVPFHALFHDLALKEMRSASIRGRDDIPDGEYGFLELYCNEAACDCRRVIINVISSTGGRKIWATINYGWESPGFYEKWSGITREVEQFAGAFLDPLNPQTEYSRALLRLFESVVADETYLERLKRHYALFKGAVHERDRARQARQRHRRTGQRRTK
jgi:hypothetical protein